MKERQPAIPGCGRGCRDVLPEGQWHYWSIGNAGWVCGETFLLIDGSFLRAAVALEDWHTGAAPMSNLYNVTKPRFFDTTHLDRASTKWRFDDPDRTPFAQAGWMATDFAAGRGFGAGQPTGQHVGERVGVLCLPTDGIAFFDIPLAEIAVTKFPFNDINSAPWAQVGRAAMEIAGKRGFAAGFFTGHQIPGRCGWIGLAPELVSVFDVDDATVGASRWAFTDIPGRTMRNGHLPRRAAPSTSGRVFCGGTSCRTNVRSWLCVSPSVEAVAAVHLNMCQLDDPRATAPHTGHGQVRVQHQVSRSAGHETRPKCSGRFDRR